MKAQLQSEVKYLTGLSAPQPTSVTICKGTTTATGAFACHGKIPGIATAGAGALTPSWPQAPSVTSPAPDSTSRNPFGMARIGARGN